MLFHAKNVCFANSWIKVLDVEIAKKSHPIIKKREDIVLLPRRLMFTDIIKLRKGDLTTVM